MAAADGLPPFTLAFRLGSIPITIDPSFWLVSLVMGSASGWPWALVWVGLVFVSVLAHELGHALASRAFGSGSRIRLYSFGGLTAHAPLSRPANVIVSLAGPVAGFVLGGAALLVESFTPVTTVRQDWLVHQILWINIGWGLMNLLPVAPLDGGHVLQSLLGPHHRRLALYVTIGTAALVAAASYSAGQLYVALLFGYLGFNAFQTLQVTDDEPRFAAPRTPFPSDGGDSS
jgi:Zn-dependent protease